jgi:hypothetical protein
VYNIIRILQEEDRGLGAKCWYAEKKINYNAKPIIANKKVIARM